MSLHQVMLGKKVVTEGTILARNGERAVVAQIKSGKFLIITAEGNRWSDDDGICSLEVLVKQIKRDGFKIIRQGGF